MCCQYYSSVSSVRARLPWRCKWSCSVARSMSSCNLPGRTGEQSSPAFHKSSSNKSSGIIHKVVGYPSLRAGIQPGVHDLTVLLVWVFFLSLFSQFTAKSCVLLCEKKKNVSHWSTQSGDASLQVPPFLGGDLQPGTTGIWLPLLTSVKWLPRWQSKHRGGVSLWSGGELQRSINPAWWGAAAIQGLRPGD